MVIVRHLQGCPTSPISHPGNTPSSLTPHLLAANHFDSLPDANLKVSGWMIRAREDYSRASMSAHSGGHLVDG